MKKKILICPPTYFDIEYEINPWMHIERKVDKIKAAEAYQELRQIYASLPSVELYEISQEANLPDMVYMADAGHVHENKFIAANFRYPERRPESAVVAAWMKQKFGYETVHLPENIFFEGHGDLIPTDSAYFLGWGKRTMFEAIPYLEGMLDKPIIDIELVDPYYYHLDTCFAPLNKDVVVINDTSFTAIGLEKIKHHFKTVISASVADHQLFGCNLVVVDNNLIVAKGISKELQTNFEKYGFVVHFVDTIEYRKGGGSVKCMSFEF